MTEALQAIRDIIQEDVGNRGLRTDPNENLVTTTEPDFAAACRSVAVTPNPAVGIVTGFFIPHGQPPAGETDGPLGALFLARALVPLGVRVVVATDPFCVTALQAGLAACDLRKAVVLVPLPAVDRPESHSPPDYWQAFTERAGPLTHLIALERVGPSHTPDSVRGQRGFQLEFLDVFDKEVPVEHQDRCHTMKGRDITVNMSPAHFLFLTRAWQDKGLTTIGIGDGGNEIGMGKVRWDVIRRNIPGGARVACRVATDHLIVCGVSNWGACGLAAGVRLLRGGEPDPQLFDPGREQELLQLMVERGPLVDGVTGQPTATVDGLTFERYVEPLRKLAAIEA